MAKSRKRKGHAKRIARRNLEKQHQKNRQQKEINNMIEQYKALLEQEAKSSLGIDSDEDKVEYQKDKDQEDKDIIDSVISESEDTK